MAEPASAPSTAEPPSNWMTFPCELDDGPAPKAAVGLIALASDLTSEPELRSFLPRDGVALYANRIPMPKEATVEALRQLEANITRTVAGLVPDNHLDVIAFGCTSGAMAIGKDRVAAHIRAAKPAIPCTDPISAGLKGLRALGCRRIAVLTPYVDEVNAVVEAYIGAQDFEVAVKGSFKQAGDPEMCRIPPSAIHQAGLELGRADVDGLFISCTALRVSPILERLEQALGKPVVSSNQALAWDCLRLAGCNEQVPGYGRLLMT